MLHADKAKTNAFGIDMIRRGFFISPLEKTYLSIPYSDEGVDNLPKAHRAVLREKIANI